MKDWGTFLEYAGLEIKDGKEVFSGSYSGIDGGDISAEYWFMGMEWSNIDDIKDDYSYLYNAWRKITLEKIKETPVSDRIKKYPDDWKLENAMDELYQKLKLQNKVSGRTIFGKNSNSLKLNLLPLPFLDGDAKDSWNKTHLTETTGFSSFKEYKSGVLPARQKLFQKLLQEGKKPKTIFCFGKDYEDDFIFALTGKRIKAREPAISLPTKHKLSGYNLKVEVYDVDSPEIKRIFVCPFPSAYTKTGYELYKLNDGDWEKIYKEVIK